MTPSPKITAAAVQGSAVKVGFSDQPDFAFHSLWLRDRCECPSCVHEASKQKTLRADGFPADIRPADARLTESGLEVVWPDGHVSCFSAKLLAASTPDGRAQRKHQPVFWDGTLAERFPTVSFGRVSRSEADRFEMLRFLVDYGVVRVSGVSTDDAQTERLAALISIIRETPHGRIYDVQTLPNVHNLAYSSDELSVHVDGSYHYYSPGPILFHFIQTSPKGGKTVLADGFSVARRLQSECPEAYALLCRLPWRNAYWNAGMDFRSAAPPIGVDRDGDLTHVILNQYTSFPDHFDVEEVEAAYGAWRRIHEIAGRADMQVRLQMPAGDAIIFDNRRVLHARTGFDPKDGPRRLRSCYMERDTLHSNLRMLAQKLGDPLQNAIFSAT
ncbi:MAG: TauD/TfdA family dioxygenase [Pseudomonadota bacterium]